jgi:hypothetical protein
MINFSKRNLLPLQLLLPLTLWKLTLLTVGANSPKGRWADNADLFIGYQTAIGTEKQFTSFNSDWGYGPGWYRGG